MMLAEHVGHNEGPTALVKGEEVLCGIEITLSTAFLWAEKLVFLRALLQFP